MLILSSKCVLDQDGVSFFAQACDVFKHKRRVTVEYSVWIIRILNQAGENGLYVQKVRVIRALRTKL
jgi:hypothetical protein